MGVTKNDDDTYNLVYGFRRFSAIKELNDSGVETPIIADVIDSSDANKLILLNVQENVSREQLTLSEEYNAVLKLSKFMTNAEIQDALGVTKTWITQRLKLGDLSDLLREAVDEGLSVRAAQAVQLLPDELHEEYASRAAGQSVSTVNDLVQSRLDELAGIDPTPTDGDDDIELLDDDDDLEPLDESDDEEVSTAAPEAPYEVKDFFENSLSEVEDEEGRKEEKSILFHSIRWNKVPDGEKILELIEYIFMAEDDETEED